MTPHEDYLPALLSRLQAAGPEDSLRLLTEAVDTHRADARPLLLLAAEFMERRDTDRAEAAYVAALMIAPDFAIARFQLGLLQFTSGRPAVATVTWAPLDQLPEGEPLRLFQRGLEALGRDEFATARALLQDGIARNTANPPLNRDMQMVIARIRALEGLPGEADAPQPAAADAHFLLSAYRVH